MQKENEDPISLELCEFCGKLYRKGHLLKHQKSKGCLTKVKSAAELGNRSILEYFKKKKSPKKIKLSFNEDIQQSVFEDHFTRLTDRQRTHILTEHDLLKFNKVVGSDIEIFGKALKLKQTDIDASRVENSNSFTTLIHKIILKWKNTNARNATLGLFTKGLQDAEAAGASIDWDIFIEGVKDVIS